MNWFNLATLSLVLAMISMCIAYGTGIFIKFIIKKIGTMNDYKRNVNRFLLGKK